MEEARVAIIGIFFLFAWTLIKAACVGMGAWMQLAWPGWAARCHAMYEDSPRRCFLVGLLNAGLFIFLAVLLMQTRVLGLLGIMILLLLLLGAVAAYSTVYRHLALRIIAPDTPELSAKSLLAAGLVAETAFFLPVLGQLWSLLLYCRAFGAVVLTLLGGKRLKVQFVDREAAERKADVSA